VLALQSGDSIGQQTPAFLVIFLVDLATGEALLKNIERFVAGIYRRFAM
jgi:hypothetical protein